MYEAEKKIQDTKVTNPILKGLIAYYKSTKVFYKGVLYEYNADYVPDRLRGKELSDPTLTAADRAEIVSYSEKAVQYLQLHKSDVDLAHSLKQATVKYDEPDIDYHGMVAYVVCKLSYCKTIRVCRCCGDYFDYASQPKTVDADTGSPKIPYKCSECQTNIYTIKEKKYYE